MNAMAATGATAVRTDTYTQVPNWFIALSAQLTGDELKTALHLFRLTAGWHRDSVIATLSQIAKAIDASRSGAIKALNGLLRRGVIRKTVRRDPQNPRLCLPTIYAIVSQAGVVDASGQPVVDASGQQQNKPEDQRKKQAKSVACIPAEQVQADELPAVGAEVAVLAHLQDFQEQLGLQGPIGRSAVCQVLKLLPLDRLPGALKRAADRLTLLRQRNRSQYRSVGVGLLITILRDIAAEFGQVQTMQTPEMPLPTLQEHSAPTAEMAHRGSVSPSDEPELWTRQNDPRSQTGGFVRAGSMLSGFLAGLSG